MEARELYITGARAFLAILLVGLLVTGVSGIFLFEGFGPKAGSSILSLISGFVSLQNRALLIPELTNLITALYNIAVQLVKFLLPV